ncbi:MAG: hypothetical protein KA436_05755 [Oligoflexales bacterium]|nr:hypothetical protein [Oligoflexales bacterium]
MTNGKRYYYVETQFKAKGQERSDKEIVILLLAAVGSKNNPKEQSRDILKARERLMDLSVDNILNTELLEIGKNDELC